MPAEIGHSKPTDANRVSANLPRLEAMRRLYTRATKLVGNRKNHMRRSLYDYQMSLSQSLTFSQNFVRIRRCVDPLFEDMPFVFQPWQSASFFTIEHDPPYVP